MKNKKLISIILALLIGLQTTALTHAEVLSENTISDEEVELAEKTVTDEEYIRNSLYEIVKSKSVYALITNADSYTMYKQIGACEDVAGILPSGTQVTIKDVSFAEDGTIFFYVSCGRNGNTIEGYVDSYHLVTADTEFNEWKETVLEKRLGARIYTEESNIDMIYRNFPSGYHSKLVELAKAHPNWTFVAHNTGLQWYDVVMAEMEGNRSLVYVTVVDSWKSKDPGDYDWSSGTYIPKSGANWFRASQTAVSFCMNPLNYLDEMHIFAFEQLTYNQDTHNREGVNAIIRNSWMYERGLEDGSGGYYCDVFMDVGRATGVSPYHLAGRVLQEQGTTGNAALISGYGGVYNYFNVKASGSTAEEILKNGTAYAQGQGWVTRYASILGGASRLGADYITKGQDTLYLQKFDVDNSYYGLYVHQYMQNIQAPTTESVSVYKAYSTAGALDNNFVFKIPVYENMPENGDYTIQDNPTSEAFLRQVYSVVLDREPDAEGLQYWLDEQKKGMTAADIVASFFDSSEMKNKNLSNEEFLSYAYRAIMGRQPDAEGKAYWLDMLSQGATRTWVVSSFVTSKEFTALCNGFGIVRGNVSNLKEADKDDNVARFVTRMYRNVLKREPDETGLHYWAGCIHNGMTASVMVRQFVGSKEFLDANISNQEYIERLYETVLGRQSDAEGMAYWIDYMNAGHGREEMLDNFIGSKEFYAICADYGIKAGD